MLPSTSESAFARLRRVYGKPALLSAGFAYGLYVLVEIDRFHGSVPHTMRGIVAGLVPCALAGCLIATAFVPLTAVLTSRARGPRGLVRATIAAAGMVGVVAALLVGLDHLGTG